jgi:hypothetical protein
MDKQETILVYVYQVNSRIEYIFRVIFDILRVPFRFTTAIEEFVAYNGPKFSYTRSRLGNEFHIPASDLISSKGIDENLQVQTAYWQGLPVLFPMNEDASLPFDLFSAAFYLLSRYEEYIVHKRDEHERFDYQSSLAYKLGFLNKPLIDLWLEKFKMIFSEVHPGFVFPSPLFYFRPLLVVGISHLYKYKGFLRQIGGLFDNLIHRDFVNIKNRFLFSLTGRKDPYDTFNKFIALKKKNRHALLTFFPVGTFSNFDHNLPVNRPVYRRLIKKMSDYSEVGLMISYFNATDAAKIKEEKKLLEEVIHKPVYHVHFHYYRQEIPVSYRILDKEEFREDFSCGYAKMPGYRASTAYPFRFYDLEEEEMTALTIHPIVITDYHLRFIWKISPAEAFKRLEEVASQIRHTGGYFQPVFHNSIISNHKEWEGWSDVYIQLIRKYGQAQD